MSRQTDFFEQRAAPPFVCPKCGFDKYVDVVLTKFPHFGRSTRRDCARCKRMICFPIWYGQQVVDEAQQ